MFFLTFFHTGWGLQVLRRVSLQVREDLADDLVVFAPRHAVEEQLIQATYHVLERRITLWVVAEICSVVAVADCVVPDQVFGAADEVLVKDVLETLSSRKLTI
jgi:hypothetical protein